MQASLSVELAQLPAIERLQLAQDLIASMTSEQEGFVANDAHQYAAQKRTAYHVAALTFNQIRASLGPS